MSSDESRCKRRERYKIMFLVTVDNNYYCVGTIAVNSQNVNRFQIDKCWQASSFEEMGRSTLPLVHSLPLFFKLSKTWKHTFTYSKMNCLTFVKKYKPWRMLLIRFPDKSCSFNEFAWYENIFMEITIIKTFFGREVCFCDVCLMTCEH